MYIYYVFININEYNQDEEMLNREEEEEEEDSDMELNDEEKAEFNVSTGIWYLIERRRSCKKYLTPRLAMYSQWPLVSRVSQVDAIKGQKQREWFL